VTQITDRASEQDFFTASGRTTEARALTGKGQMNTHTEGARDAEPRPDSAPIVCARCGASPWLDIVAAARWACYACPNGRAPNSIYTLAARIGHKLNGQWRIHRDDLDAALRGER
jgi:hypothetical protein